MSFNGSDASGIFDILRHAARECGEDRRREEMCGTYEGYGHFRFDPGEGSGEFGHFRFEPCLRDEGGFGPQPVRESFEGFGRREFSRRREGSGQLFNDDPHEVERIVRFFEEDPRLMAKINRFFEEEPRLKQLICILLADNPLLRERLGRLFEDDRGFGRGDGAGPCSREGIDKLFPNMPCTFVSAAGESAGNNNLWMIILVLIIIGMR